MKPAACCRLTRVQAIAFSRPTNRRPHHTEILDGREKRAFLCHRPDTQFSCDTGFITFIVCYIALLSQ